METKKKKTTSQLNVRADNDLLAKLKQESTAKGKSVTALVILAIRRLLGLADA